MNPAAAVDVPFQKLDRAAAFVEEHHTFVLALAAVLLVVLTLFGWWARRRPGRIADLAGRFCDTAAVAVAVALSAEGMWEAATEALHLAPYQALLLFAFAELSMLRAARRARVKVDKGDPPGVYGQTVWGIALLAAAVATSNAPNVTEHMIRFGAPLLVAWQWWADLVDALREKTGGVVRQRSSWIWTPRRIGIHLGLIQPGEQDLVQIDRDRRTHRLTVTAHRLHHGSARLARWRKAKLRRLALQSDDAMVTEARRRVARVNQIEQLTRPDAAPVDKVDDATRATLDEVRLIMRQATTKLRSEHRTAFAGDPVWSQPPPPAPRTAVEWRSGAPGDAPARPAVAHPDAPGDAPADAGDAPGDALDPADTRTDAERDAALDAAVTAVLTRGVAKRKAARDAGLPEVAVRRAVDKALAANKQPPAPAER